MNSSLQLIQQLSEAKGVPGHEEPVNKIIINHIQSFASVSQDIMKNLIIQLPNYDPNKPNIMVDCHADEVGFLVQNINSNGTLTLSTLGGWFVPNIMGSPLWVGNEKGDYFLGIVGSTPPHFLKESERSQIPPLGSLFVDIGAKNPQEVEEIFGITKGCPVVPHSPFFYDNTTDTIFGKALDNRLGCALMIEILTAFKNEKLPFNLVGSSSTQEEMGLRGAHLTATQIQPKAALILESTPADDIYPGNPQTILGKGPQIRFKDSTILTSPELVRFTRELAKQNHIPLQLAVRDTGGTNAGTIHLKNAGIFALPIAVPTRYIHSHTGMCKFSDYLQTRELAKIWIQNLHSFFQ